MRRKTSAFILTAQLLVSCKSTVMVDENINKNAPLYLNDNHLNKDIIDKNSDKHAKIVDWITSNTGNWKTTVASYVTDVYVTQANFRLLYLKGSDSVIIGFVDKEGKPRQYSKQIEKGELDFLFEK